MDARCTINFCLGQPKDWVSSDGWINFAKVYRHQHGYPDSVLPDLDRFFADVKEQTPNDTRFDDPGYLAARYVVWEAQRNAHADGKPLDFLDVGICLVDPGDIQYTYFVDCQGHDPQGRPVVIGRKLL